MAEREEKVENIIEVLEILAVLDHLLKQRPTGTHNMQTLMIDPIDRVSFSGSIDPDSWFWHRGNKVNEHKRGLQLPIESKIAVHGSSAHHRVRAGFLYRARGLVDSLLKFLMLLLLQCLLNLTFSATRQPMEATRIN